MSIVHYFELICDHCDQRFEDMHERALLTPAEVRANAKKAGWTHERPSRIHVHNKPVDLCPGCNSKGAKKA